jgi:molybdenum cofactor biosynthesis enzyme MoaA
MKKYCHTPGERGRGAVLDTGLSCPHSCLFCYYKEYNGTTDFQALRKGSFRSTDSLMEILSLFPEHGYGHFDITGGEPTLHPDIVRIIQRGCTELGLAGRIITLGQFLQERYVEKRPLIDALLDAGLTDILFSFHAADKTEFHQFTKGSLERLEKAMGYLDNKDFQYGTNTVVFKGNVETLENIAERIINHGVYIHNFILFNAYHGWRNASMTSQIQADYSTMRPALEKAVLLLDQAGIAVNIRYAPYCVLKGMERHIVGLTGSFYDPFEWQNRACSYDKPPSYCSAPVDIEDKYPLINVNTTLPDGKRIVAMRGDFFTVFPEICNSCKAMRWCDGIAPIYLHHHGTDEFSPYDKFDAAGVLPEARLDYPLPFHVKNHSLEKIR